MRGIVALEVLRQLEAVTGRRIHQMFDFICGVSTGAIIASFLGFHKKTIDEIEEIYKRLGQEIFTRNLIKGTTGWITSVTLISKIPLRSYCSLFALIHCDMNALSFAPSSIVSTTRKTTRRYCKGSSARWPCRIQCVPRERLRLPLSLPS